MDRGKDDILGWIQYLRNDIEDVIPEYLYWPVKDAKPDLSLKTNRFAGGDNLENTGVASLLAYQDIDNVISFVNPRKISWALNYSARYWFHSALKKS